MNKMNVYFITNRWMGVRMTLEPRVPESKDMDENDTTPRICVAQTILGCLQSIGATSLTFHSDDHSAKIYIYKAKVPVKDIYQPTVEDVPDVWQTGELWIMQPTSFTLESSATLRKHLLFPKGIPYARYSLTFNGEDEVVDRAAAYPVYGEYDAFSFIDYDHSNCKGECGFDESGEIPRIIYPNQAKEKKNTEE